MSPKLDQMLARIKVVICDVDGVLTDGIKWYNRDGLAILGFNVRDGRGAKTLIQAGIHVGLLTDTVSEIVTKRATDLGITDVVMGASDKEKSLSLLANQRGWLKDSILYIGDDLPDLGAFRCAGVCVAPADAVQPVRAQAHWVTESQGGGGVLREVADQLLLRTVK